MAKTPCFFLSREIFRYRTVTEPQAVFALLIWGGVPRPVAFKVAFPESKAAPGSIAQLASRIVNNPDLRRVFRSLALHEGNLRYTYPADIQCFRN